MILQLKHIWLFGVLLLLGWSGIAQVPGTDPTQDGGAGGGRNNNVPPQDVRTMAEWEETEGIVLAWRNQWRDVLTEIVRYAKDEGLVYIVTTDSSPVREHLTEADITDQDNIRYIIAGTNSVWIRDFGPWTVYLDKVEERGISDYRYNRPRPRDDQVPYEVAEFVGDPIYNADEDPLRWIHSGGNFLRDGMGNAYSSDLVLRENSGKTGQEIESYAALFFGIDDYRILSRLNYDTIHHLDMHMRILDEETIAIGEYPLGLADGPVIEQNLSFIRNHYRTPFGRPYRIMRLPMPPQDGQYPPYSDYLTYTNSVFINGTILVPTYEIPEDEVALQQYRDYFPGYRVVGIDCREIITRLGALHCITKLIGVREPLWIAHPRLRDTYNSEEPYAVDAWLYHEAGIASAQLYYRFAEEASFLALEMEPHADDPDLWQAYIPPQEAGTEVQYYIEAIANNGKRQLRPLPAPQAYYHFRIKEWESLPVADWVQTQKEVAPGTQLLFSNTSSDGPTAQSWMFPGGSPEVATTKNVTVEYTQPGTYAVSLTVENPQGNSTYTRTNALRVREAYLPFAEHFTSGESSIWEIVNPDSEMVAWRWRPDGGCEGACLEVPHRLANQKLNREYLRTAVDLREYGLAELRFKVAYAQRHPAHFDELRVNLIDQFGRRHNIYNKGGNVLSTIDSLVPDFVPEDCTHWREEIISLQEWEGSQVLLEIESIGDRGNSIYLDELTIAANALPEAVIAYPLDGTLYNGDGLPLADAMRVEAYDPDGEIDQVDFFLGNDYLGVLSEPIYEMPFTLPSIGDYYLQARATDDQGSQVWTERILVRYDIENGIYRPSSLPIDVSIIPNPVGTRARILIQSTYPYRGAEFDVLDASGRLMRSWQANIGIGQTEIGFANPKLSAGTYHLRIRYQDKQFSMPWVKM